MAGTGSLGSAPVTQHPGGPGVDSRHSPVSDGATGPTKTCGVLFGVGGEGGCFCFYLFLTGAGGGGDGDVGATQQQGEASTCLEQKVMSPRCQARVYFVYCGSRGDRRKEKVAKTGADTHYFNPEKAAPEIARPGVFLNENEFVPPG